MVLGVEKILGFFGSCKECKPGFVFSMRNPLRRDTAVDEPISDLIFSLLRWAESLDNFFRSPVLCKIWRIWVRSVW
jgi:hypothetical protein